ncbi:hypothetical protein SAMN05216428_104155 [Nitrosospira sp. Nsp11]|uniref:hypothetical protein n=1 Tax=Nitrosospira sp. Nsp11 TaxID=1855338 RepID=UPI00091615EA|nr:hypothetical protein [Nitrosospira sp. Nsp11]SHL63932.1 hypothetical protein SAMN05216428_104155 [Nitrosospira sp. Nsp11]
MSSTGQLYFASNKEIHDLLLSAKLRITESVLHELLRDRGIFYPPNEEREVLVDRLSILPHDYKDICGLIEATEQGHRGEKTTAVRLNLALNGEELKAVITTYQTEATTEKVHSFKKSEDEYFMNVEYSEYDYSKTKLVQRRLRDASFEFIQKDGWTEIRFPATEKGRAIVDKIIGKIEEKKKIQVKIEEIELTNLTASEDRTTFFTKLISSLPNFPLENVSRLRVAHADAASNPSLDLETEGEEEAEEKMLSVVRKVALAGDNLVASSMYKELKAGGFFITSITWRVKQNIAPYSIVEFDAGFEDGQDARKFRYSVRGVLRFNNGKYPKHFRAAEDKEKAALLSILEDTARSVLVSLLVSGNIPKLADTPPEAVAV